MIQFEITEDCSLKQILHNTFERGGGKDKREDKNGNGRSYGLRLG